MRRALLTFFSLYLLWALIAQLNHAISGWHVSLFLGGLFVVFAALRLEHREGLIAVFAAGLLHDANAPFVGLLDSAARAAAEVPQYSNAPVWFGCHAFLFAAGHTFIHHVRDRVPRGEPLIAVLAALLANLGIFLGVSFATITRGNVGDNAWPRLVVDLVLSQTLLAFIAPWFLAFQARALGIGGVALRRESQRVS